MSPVDHPPEVRMPPWPRYWRAYLAGLVLLVWADLGTTMAAADAYGLGAEANPIMRSLLGYDLGIVLSVHLLVFIFAVLAFDVVVRIGRSLNGKRADWYRIGCAVWITGMIVIGMVVVLNNLALTVFHVLA